MLRRLVAAAALSALLSLGVQGQTSQTIKFVVPFAPGGTADILARLLAEEIGKAHGVGTLIENRPGAGRQHPAPQPTATRYCSMPTPSWPICANGSMITAVRSRNRT